MDEKALLEKMQKALGVSVDFTTIEEKHARKRKEDALLAQLNETFNNLINKNQDKAEIIEREVIETIEVLAEETPVIIEDAPGTAGRQPEPELPKKDIVNRSVEMLSKVSQKDIQKAADTLPTGTQKELDIIKKSIADLHRFASRHSQLGGGGEVKLARLDDVNSTTIADHLYLRYDAASKMFVFDSPLGPGGVQVDWNQSNTSAPDYIKDKPDLTVYAYANSLVQADWNEANTLALDYIKNKPLLAMDSNGNISVSASIVSNNQFSLGTLAQPWAGLYLSSNSLNIAPDIGNTNILIENLNGVMTLVTGGMSVNDLTQTYELFIVDANNGFTTVRSKGGNSNTAVFNISNNPSQTLFPPGGTSSAVLHLQGPANGATSVDIDNFTDSATNSNRILFRKGRGSVDTPTAVQNNDVLGQVGAVGYIGNAFSTPAARIQFIATENFSSSNSGTKIGISLTPPGTNTNIELLDLNYDGLTVYPTSGQSNTSIKIFNQNDLFQIAAGGFAVNDPSNTFFTFAVSNTGLATHRVPSPSPGQAVLNISANPSANVIPLVSTVVGGVLHATGSNSGPTLVTIDSVNDSNVATQTASAIVMRKFRGTVDNVSPVSNNDVLGTITAVGYGAPTGPYNSNGLPASAQNWIRWRSIEDHTLTAQGAQLEFNLIPTGSIVAQTTLIMTASGNQPGLQFIQTNTGITFTDGSFQTTAFNSSNAVTSISVGTGLTQTNTVGAVGINATGVLSVAGTNNQVIVANVGQNITLSTPQNLNTNATVQFNTLTVQNLTVTGTSTIANNQSLSNKQLNLAYNSTSNSQIDNGGITLGNTSAGYERSLLYNLATDTWNLTGSFATGNVSSNSINGNNIFIANAANFGNAFAGYDYPNAIIQIDQNLASYSQVVQQNHSSSVNASTDYVAVNDQGNDSIHYIDLGINSSTWSNTQWTINGPNDGYLYVSDGNLSIGTDTSGKTITFFTSGTLANNLVATISDSGLTVVNNVTANTFTGNLTGNVTGNLSGTANNANYLGTVAANQYVTIANTTSVYTNYALSSSDYYVGVANATSNVTITLPSTVYNGKQVIIKDEVGNCASNPITVSGGAHSIDNSTSATMKINNMALSLIYNNGWRII